MATPMPMPILTASDEARFWSKVNRAPDPDQCWEWAGDMMTVGYGRISLRFRDRPRTHVGAHRVAWFIATGAWPGDLLVCHTCDNRKCVNPNHLFLGTHGDNLKDAARKGRMAPPHYVGEANPAARLTTIQVLEIRRLSDEGMSRSALARQFGIGISTASEIARRLSWEWL